jgi:bifunctional UDP-N-acetylglucosamine pyrophosphorylase/glucosamine-1-phosphate N-acetyltransferase
VASPLHIVILAAGKGTRMKSARPKVLHEIGGLPIIEHVLRAADGLHAATTTLVVGHGADDVKVALSHRPGLEFVIQSPQLGTGDALRRTEAAMKSRRGTLLLLYGDVPLLESNTLTRLIEAHHAAHAAATVLTAEVDDPYGYGRIVRDTGGKTPGAIARIVEERDASGEERAIREINSGIYAFALQPLFEALGAIASDNSQGEYYLTDLVTIYRQRGKVVETLRLDNATELRGINTRADLADLDRIVRRRKNHALMLDGVTFEDPGTTYVDEDVVVGADTTLGPLVQLQGRTKVGERCRIHAGSRLTHATVGDDVTVLDRCVIVQSTVGNGVAIGPFAHIRPDSAIADHARIGNFVELKKTSMGEGSKANHLAYLGDATIGQHVNIGAGTITCNYDGVTKQPTIIEDDVFIGSDSQLIAPVRIGKGAYVAAGSSITDDVPADALAIARGRQDIKPGWASRRRANQPAKKA